jgi:hypothetical protein
MSRDNESVWIQPLEISEQDRKELSTICKDPLFIDGVREIAENYRAYSLLYKNKSKPAEDMATLKDLAGACCDLANKLQLLPGTVSAKLYKQYDNIKTLKSGLMALCLESMQVIAKTTKNQGGRPKEYSKQIAADNLYQLFAKFKLPWPLHNGEEKTNQAMEVLDWIFEQAGDQAAKISCLSYIKKACPQSTNQVKKKTKVESKEKLANPIAPVDQSNRWGGLKSTDKAKKKLIKK